MVILTNPIFRMGWGARNTGNTSDIQVKGASCAAFIEGEIVYDNRPTGVCAIQASVGLTRTNIITFRNRTTFQDVTNRAEIILRRLVLSTDTTQTALFELIINPETAGGDVLEFEYVDEDDSLMEIATNPTQIADPTGDSQLTSCIPIKEGQPFSVVVNEIIGFLPPETTVCIAARVSNGAASEMIASAAWVDDL